jgi:hypothetical protein
LHPLLHTEPEFEALERPINRAGAPLRLAVRRAEVTAAPVATSSAWLDGLKTGDWVDCLERNKRWRVAKVAAVSADGATLTISYKGFSSNFDEAVPRSLKRLAAVGCHTAGQDTRMIRRQGEALSVDVDTLASLEIRINELMAGTFPAEERVRARRLGWRRQYGVGPRPPAR